MCNKETLHFKNYIEYQTCLLLLILKFHVKINENAVLEKYYCIYLTPIYHLSIPISLPILYLCQYLYLWRERD